MVFEMSQRLKYWRLTPETRAAVEEVYAAEDRQADARVILRLVDKVLKHGQAYRRGYDIGLVCLDHRKKSRNGRTYFAGASGDLRPSQSMLGEKFYYEGTTYLIDKCVIKSISKGPVNNPDFVMYFEGKEVGEKTRERPLTAPWYNPAVMKKRKSPSSALSTAGWCADGACSGTPLTVSFHAGPEQSPGFRALLKSSLRRTCVSARYFLYKH